MDRRSALYKAVITTSDASSGLLSAERQRSFVRALKDSGGELTRAMRQETRVASTGTIDKLSTGTRLIRAATENSDDGYRAGAAYTAVSYTTKKIRLPWEVTEDVFHENIEGESHESTLVDEMTTQFSDDLEDLAVNGDSTSGDAFVQIDDGILKLVADQAGTYPARNVNQGNVALTKAHFFDALYAMPNKYRKQAGLKWIMSPTRKIGWWESVTDRATASGDAALLGQGGLLDSPLGIPIMTVPTWPDNVIFLADPRQFVRVISWGIRRRRITGETDAQLAALDKRLYIYFLKLDTVVEEFDAVVRLYNIGAV